MIPSVQSKERVYNFAPGPAALPLAVLERMQAELLNYKGLGVSVFELGHRTPPFVELGTQVRQKMRDLLSVPDDYEVLFMQGGARMQFAAVPMNLAISGSASYLVTGFWSQLAYEEANRLITPYLAYNNYEFLEGCLDCKALSLEGDYLHYADNETLSGLCFPHPPKTPLPLVADMSSSLFSREIRVSDYALIYAAAQKQFGSAGVTAVIVRKDLLGKARANTPAMLNYQEHAAADSMYNTPVTFAWYVVGLVLEWMESQGGVAGMQARNEKKAQCVNQALNTCRDFYRPMVPAAFRSDCTISFWTPSPELDKTFVIEAMQEGLCYLKGHVRTGGIRACMYNPFPLEGARLLAEFMRDFAKRYG